MTSEFNGIEKRFDELNERLARLESLRSKTRAEYDSDPLLRDIVERNLEVAIQCCIDICHRVIALQNARKPVDNYEGFIILGELGILPADFARQLAPIAGLRNILVHEYLIVDWDQILNHLQNLNDLSQFSSYVRTWLLSHPS